MQRYTTVGLQGTDTGKLVDLKHTAEGLKGLKKHVDLKHTAEVLQKGEGSTRGLDSIKQSTIKQLHRTDHEQGKGEEKLNGTAEIILKTTGGETFVSQNSIKRSYGTIGVTQQIFYPTRKPLQH